MKADPMPALQLEAEPCRRCGAADLQEAETRCQVRQDVTGEYECLGGCDELPDGRLGYPTAASIAALDAWCDREHARCHADVLLELANAPAEEVAQAIDRRQGKA